MCMLLATMHYLSLIKVLDSDVISYFFLIVDVEIYWHERESLLFTPIHTEGFGIGGRAKYEVSTDCLNFA